jgi:sec-independent protein translocase protein TatA
MPSIGPLELVVVLVIALLILGPKKLPEVGRSVGRGMREFKDSITGAGDDQAPAQMAAAPVEAAPVEAAPAHVAAAPSPARNEA